MSSTKPKNMYVDNKKFFEDILEYRKAIRKAKRENLPEPRIPESVGLAILLIAQNLSLKPCFAGYSFKEEMIGDGYENCILYFKDYDPKKGTNPFAYFTQIIYYAFLRRIHKEEKNRYITYKNFQHSVIHGGDHHDIMAVLNDGGEAVTKDLYDNINDFMGRFEKKEHEKKVKRAAKAAAKAS